MALEAFNQLIQQYGSRIREWSIEVQVNNLSGKYFFPDDQILRNKTIVGMYFWAGADVQPENNRDLVDKNAQENSFLYLLSGADILLNGAPLAAFGQTDTDKSIKTFYLDNWTPSKSYILVGNPAAIMTSGDSYWLTFIYLD